MQMTKFTHACVRLHDGDRALLLDPGIWSEPEVFDGVTDVLITHEHADHVDVQRLAEVAGTIPDLRVYAPDPIATKLRQELGAAAVTTVAAGQRVEAAGFTVDVVGGAHAEIYEGLPGCTNVGYVVAGGGQTVYHPGDSLFVPDAQVDVLLTPISGPWFKLGEGLDFVRAVAPGQAYPIHDRLLTEDIGQPLVDQWMDTKSQTKYARAPIGVRIDL
jgi:L-ascorbate metabolism protein UlaG (beta-lactamase superfamily)